MVLQFSFGVDRIEFLVDTVDLELFSSGTAVVNYDLTLRLLMSYIYIYIYGAPILDVSRSHTTTHHNR